MGRGFQPSEITLLRKICSFPGETADADLARRLFLLCFISLIGVATLIPLGILALVEESLALGSLDLLLAVFLLLNLAHVRVYRRFELNITLGITFTAGLFIFAFVTGGRNLSACVWYYTFPLISSFLLGARRGLTINLLMLIPVIAVFLAPRGGPFLADYHLDFKLRFIPSYLVVVFFAYLAEHARERNREAVQKAYDKLEERVEARTRELSTANATLEMEVAVRRKAEQGLSERISLLALSTDIGKALVRNDPLETILLSCTDALVSHLDAAFARIWILNEEDSMLELKASSGMYTNLDGAHSRIAVGDKKIGLIAATGAPVLSNSVIGDPHITDQEWAVREGMISFAGHPLHLGGRLVGVMALFSRRRLPSAVLDSLASVADQIAIGINRRQTDEKLAFSESFLRSIVANEPECVKLVDEGGIVVDMNASGLRMLGARRPEEVIGKPLIDVVHPDHRPAVEAFSRQVLGGTGGDLEFEVIGLEGSHRWLESHAVPLFDARKNRTLVLAVTRDITERNQAEKALRKAKQDLERQNEDLKKLDKMKGAFVYAVSHELKTPISKHSMQLEILKPLLEKYDLTEMERDSIRIMEESIRRQQGVVRNLLDLTRLESGRRPYRIEDIELDEVCSLVEEEYEYALKMFDVEMKIDVPPQRLRTDREMLWHVLSNTVNNAIKFRRREGKAVIDVRSRSVNGRVVIQVADNGLGLRVEELGNVFDRFYQASSSIEGSGVGLTICKLIVEGLGGTISLESEGPGRGTTVRIELPAEMAAGPGSPA